MFHMASTFHMHFTHLSHTFHTFASGSERCKQCAKSAMRGSKCNAACRKFGESCNPFSLFFANPEEKRTYKQHNS